MSIKLLRCLQVVAYYKPVREASSPPHLFGPFGWSLGPTFERRTRRKRGKEGRGAILPDIQFNYGLFLLLPVCVVCAGRTDGGEGGAEAGRGMRIGRGLLHGC